MALKKTDKGDGGWEQVRDAVLVKGTLRSPLWYWMRQNHDRLSALFEQVPPTWAVLAETFGGLGLTDRAGKSLTAETARKTWYRVRQDMKRVQARRAVPAAGDPVPGVAFTSPPMTSSPSPPVPVSPLDGEPAPPERQFRMTSLKSVPPGSAVRENDLPFDADVPEQEPSAEPEFKFATLPASSSPEARSGTPKPPAVAQRQDPDQVIARLLARPRWGTIPMPDIPEPEDE